MPTTFVDLIPSGNLPGNPALDILQFNQNIIKAFEAQKPRPKTIILTRDELKEILQNVGDELVARLFPKNNKGEFVCNDCGKPVFIAQFTQESVVNESVNEVMYERNL